MQRLDLKPDHLVMLDRSEEPQVVRIGYSDTQSILMAQDGWAQLSPREYLLVMVLLRQRERWYAASGEDPLCVHLQQLMALVGSTSSRAVMKALNRAALKVAALGVHIFPLLGMDCYFALLDADIATPQTKQAHPFHRSGLNDFQ